MFLIEEVYVDPTEIKLEYPNLQSSNGGVAIIQEPTYAQVRKQGDSSPSAGK